MIKFFYIILLLLPLASQAQIKVWDKETYFDHEKKEVVVNMKVEALKVDGTVSMDFVIRDDSGNSTTLPAIIYASSARYWHILRSAQTPWVYRTKQSKKEIGKDKLSSPITTDYTARIPHEEWMNHAQLAVNQVRYENCGDWLVDTLTIVHDIMVDPDPQVEITPEPQIWRPDPALYARMVGFMTPDVEGVKRRAAMVRLNINYPVNVYKVIPTYMNNPNELPKVDTMMNVLLKDEFITINSYNITGYASPEGSYSLNTTLSRNRSNGFKTYVLGQFNIGNRPITTEWVPEDWEGLAKAVNESDLDRKHAILDIINTTTNPDARDAKIRALDGGYTYNELLKSYYPPLRRIELRADYTVRSFTDEEAKDLIYKRPELLSIDEMYRVALFYKPGTSEYRKVYEIAAKHYPKDVIANNNAAAAILLTGDIDAAKVYLEKISDDPRSYINRGVVAYIEGDIETAKEYFRTAAEEAEKSGHTALYQSAQCNLELLENTRK